MDFDPAKDYYAQLKLDRSATQEQVKRAYFALAKKYHPDTKRALHDEDVEEVFTEVYQQINEAYGVLGDAARRRAYDAARAVHDGHGAPHATPGNRSGASAPHGAAPPPFTGTKPQHQHSHTGEVELPPVIRSDRGVLFVRMRPRAPYIGEDGVEYTVTPEGTIRAISQSFIRSMDRYVVVGSAGEVAFAYIGRMLMRAVWAVLRAASFVLLHYPLLVSMLLVHRNPLRRLRQERTCIHTVLYLPVMALSIVIALTHVFLLLRGEYPAAVGVSLALHVAAASLLLLDLRLPYLRLLERSGETGSLTRARTYRHVRWSFVASLTLAQTGGVVWTFLPYLQST